MSAQMLKRPLLFPFFLLIPPLLVRNNYAGIFDREKLFIQNIHDPTLDSLEFISSQSSQMLKWPLSSFLSLLIPRCEVDKVIS